MIISAKELIESAKMQCSIKNPREAKEFYNKHRSIIIDLREPSETTESSKIPYSVNIPRGLLEIKITEYCKQHDVPIILHCASGGRAFLSACTLQLMGYSNVHVIDAEFDEIIKIFT